MEKIVSDYDEKNVYFCVVDYATNKVKKFQVPFRDISDVCINTTSCHGDKCRRDIEPSTDHWCTACYGEVEDLITHDVVNVIGLLKLGTKITELEPYIDLEKSKLVEVRPITGEEKKKELSSMENVINNKKKELENSLKMIEILQNQLNNPHSIFNITEQEYKKFIGK